MQWRWKTCDVLKQPRTSAMLFEAMQEESARRKLPLWNALRQVFREKRTKICGRWFNGVRWHLWQGDCTWSLLTWMNARDPCGKPLTRMVWSSENFNRLIQLIESDCSYVFYVMWCVLFTLHDIWLASNECTKMHLVSSWRTSNGQLMVSCSETSQQILFACDRMCLSDCKGQPSYDWNVLLGSTFFLGFQLSAMNQVTERWEVICSDDDGLTCSGNSSSIRRWEKTNDVMQADLVFFRSTV